VFTGNTQLLGGKRPPDSPEGTPYVDAAGNTYTVTEEGLIIGLASGGSITILEWTKDRNLEIFLTESEDWPPTPPSPPRDPLVLDLDGDGVELIGVDQSNASFDFAKDGFRERVGWLSSDDAFLVRDLNGNNVVNGIDELFGSLSEDGFSALRSFDSNLDGRVDASDANFGVLRLWRDLDGDGVSDWGEVFSLDDYGVAAIELAAAVSGRANEGNIVDLEGQFVRADGSKGFAEAILFATNTTISEWNMPEGFEVNPEAMSLPNLRGYGLLPDLAYAMTLDEDLREQAESFVGTVFSGSADDLQPAFIDLLFVWAGVTDVNPQSRGAFVDARQVAFLEKYFGGSLTGFEETSLPARLADTLNETFSTVVETLLTRYLAQAAKSGAALGIDADAILGSPFGALAGLGYEHGNDRFRLSDIEEIVDIVFDTVPGFNEAQQRDYIVKAVIALSGLSFEYFGPDGAEEFSDLASAAILRATGSDALAMLAGGIEGHLVVGGETADSLTGTNGADFIAGLHGNDTIDGGLGLNKYFYSRGDGHDRVLVAEESELVSDRIAFTGINASEVTLAIDGDNLTLNIRESATDAGDGGSILLVGALKNFQIHIGKIKFADGTTWTADVLAEMLLDAMQTEGNDVINGFGDDETIRGGEGDDTINGSFGHDEYVYSRGDGNDTIFAENNIEIYRDKIRFTDINAADVTLARSGNDVIINIAETAPGAGDGGSISLTGALKDRLVNIGEVIFADGMVWSAGEIASGLHQATNGNDTILGFDVGETIRGGQGNDVIDGRRGSDTIVYARGDGNDSITDSDTVYGSTDTLLFEDIASTEVTIVRDGDDLVIIINESVAGGDGGEITLRGHWGIYHYKGIELFSFSDGVEWDDADVAAMTAQQSTSGDDLIQGDSHNQTFRGGRGNDTILGGGGADTYLYARGDGNDTIGDPYSDNSDGYDSLVLADINPADVTLVRSGVDLKLVVRESAPGSGDGGSILVRESLEPYGDRGEDSVVFADGTVWSSTNIATMLLALPSDGDDAIFGSRGDDVISGGTGNDTLDGGMGTDVYRYSRGDGNDTIREGGSGGNYGSQGDQLLLTDVNVADVSLVRNGTDVTLVIAESEPGAGDGGSILLQSGLNEEFWNRAIDQIVFADGTTWTRSDLRVALLAQASTSGNDTITGFNVADVIDALAGNDTINGGEGNDTIRGGTGNDIRGWSGNDTHLYRRGDGSDTIYEGFIGGSFNDFADTLRFTDINASAVTLTRSGDDLMLVIAETAPGAGDGGSVLLKQSLIEDRGIGTDQVVFADGTTWSRNDIRLKLLEQASTTGNDTITGFDVADTITGGHGNDALSGGGEADTYIYRRGDGSDTITENSWDEGNDRLRFLNLNEEDISVSRNGNDLVLLIHQSSVGAGDGGTIVIKGMLGSSVTQGIERFEFADGTVLDRAAISALVVGISGTDGDETINGTTAADDVQAGLGNDRLLGGAGSDSYFYRSGDGNDTIEELTTGTDVDRLVLIDLNQADLSFERSFSSLNDIVLRVVATGQTITLKTQLDQEGGVEKIVFADGSILGGNDWSLDGLLLPLVTIAGTSANDNITGTAAVDRIAGYDGNDILNGAAGADTLIGGLGDDTFVVDNVGDVVVEAPNEGTDLVQSSVSYALSADVENLTLTGSASINATGNALANVLTGTSGNNVLTGGAGADSLNGGNGTDTASYAGSAAGVAVSLLTGVASGGDADGDTLNSIEYLSGSTFSDMLVGNTLSNVLSGLAGNDSLDGGAGNDTLSGGLGDDTYTIDTTGDIVTELTDEGTDFVYSSVSYTVTANVENLTLTGSLVLNGTGNALANIITGNAGNNTLAGLAGADQLIGGDGLDTASYAASTAGVRVSLASGLATGGDAAGDSFAGIENLAGSNLDDELEGNASANVLAGGSGIDLVSYRNATGGVTVNLATTSMQNTVAAGSDTLSGFENLEGSDFADVLTGTSSANLLRGLSGNDSLNGAAGADTMIGGLGDDIYVVDNVADSIVEDTSEGTDLVQSGVSIALGEHVENLTLTGSASINGTGNGGANILIGNGGANILEGGAGADTLDGAAGLDTVSYSGSDAAVTIDLATNAASGGHAAGDTLAGFENIIGSAFADVLGGSTAVNVLSGLAGNDALSGGGGNDVLDGGLDADTMTGGLGNDTFVVDDAGDVVVDGTAEGTDTVQTSISYVLGDNLEHLTLIGLASINGTGNALANTITGNAADNVVNGGGGNDSLDGGLGADTLLGGDGNDSLFGGAGPDTMSGGIGNDTYTVDDLGDAIVELSAEGTDSVSASVSFTLSAHVENLTLTGSAAINAGGNDLANAITGNSGNNQLLGGDGNDTLSGAAAADVLIGGTGNDILVGGAGLDILTGGDGDDVFDFNAINETAVVAANADLIEDFLQGDDLIDLSGIDANSSVSGNNAFSFVGTAAFTGLGQVRYSLQGDETVLELNTTGDTGVDAIIRLSGAVNLAAADFLL
jgi:Ca2+-binding RTX toxin-like protein